MPTPVSSTTLALLLADSRLPVGAHVTSNALEAALQDGLARDRVGEYMAARMDTVVRVEAGTAVVARHLCLRDGADARLPEVVRHWEARTPSPAQRDIAVSLGSGLRRLATRIWPGAARRIHRGDPRPLVLGILAAHGGIEAEDLVRMIAYDDAQTVASALLKLEPGDPLDAAGLVLAACSGFEPHVEPLCRLADPEDIPTSGAPQSEEWAQAQSVLPRRLFRA